MLCINGGGDRSRCSPEVSVDCGPVTLRFLLKSPKLSEKGEEKKEEQKWPRMLVQILSLHIESRFLFILDAPDGLPGLTELPPPDCVAGGCQ